MNQHRRDKSNQKRTRKSQKNLHCVVHFLDQTALLFRCNGKDNGKSLMDQVIQRFSLREPQYFGLSFPGVHLGYCWLEFEKSLSHQFKCSAGQVHLNFEVKYYVENPSQLLDEQTRWLFFLQTWKRVVNGSLPTSPQTCCLLTSYYLQATYGPISSEADDLSNISNLGSAPTVVKENTSVILELRGLLKEQSIEKAQTNFLDHVRRVELYGVDLHPVKDAKGKSILLGISGRNLSIYRSSNNVRINSFAWCKILRLFYKKKRFFIQLQHEKFEEYDTVVGFLLPTKRAAKRLWKNCIEQHSFFRLGCRQVDPKQITKGVWPVFRKLFTVQSCYNVREPSTRVAVDRRSITYRRYDHLHKVQSTTEGTPPRPAWSSSLPGSLDDDDCKSGVKEAIPSLENDSSSASPISAVAFIPNGMQSFEYADEDSQPDIRLPLYLSDASPSVSCSRHSTDQFDVRLKADASGVFGFNLRFEKERASARLSRLLPNSSADMSYPPMHVGDELVAVEGHPVECLTQTELMELFRAARQSSLTLSLRRTGYCWTEQEEDPPVQYVLEPAEMSPKESVAAIVDGLRTGRILSHFDLLPRSRPELSSSIARRDENIQKNRYGDIFPYDCNRVVLSSCDNQDENYINASYINIPMPGGNKTLRYVATQGPLPHTVEDFWSLVWQEEGIRTIAMVTQESERGRIKCHRYWPEMDEIVRAGQLVIVCQAKLDHLGPFVHREFLLTDERTGEMRVISHVQYLEWPDHGAPVLACQFLDYVRHVQTYSGNDCEEGAVVLVHCSAGIGRTGAFILLDSAMRLIQADCAVNPIHLVKMMRDQRPMMLQTSIQFQYVCECIIESSQV